MTAGCEAEQAIACWTTGIYCKHHADCARKHDVLLTRLACPTGESPGPGIYDMILVSGGGGGGKTLRPCSQQKPMRTNLS